MTAVSPDCRDTNHTKCDERAWDLEADALVFCQCECHKPVYMSPSEVRAEELYGPPPVGDEEPHAGVAVPDPGETSGPPIFATQAVLDSLPDGTVILDKDHDQWTKFGPELWKTYPEGPIMRSKTLATCWAPFTIVSTPKAAS